MMLKILIQNNTYEFKNEQKQYYNFYNIIKEILLFVRS